MPRLKKPTIRDYKILTCLLGGMLVITLGALVYIGQTWEPKSATEIEDDNIDPSPLEQAITEEIPNGYDTYDVELRYYIDTLSEGYVNVEITGKTFFRRMDLSQID